MSKPQKAESDPVAVQTVIPHLVCHGAAEAIAFYEKAFGAEEIMKLPGPDGRLWHAAVQIGDAKVMLVDEMPEWGSLGPKALKGTPVTIHLQVADADAFAARAVAAGAKVIMPVEDAFWGDRYGVLEDPFGHRWSVATHVRDVSIDDLHKAVAAMPPMECPGRTEDAAKVPAKAKGKARAGGKAG